IYRMREYAAAKVPVISVVKGIPATKVLITFLIAGFIIFSTLLTVLGFSGIFFLVVVSILGLSWLGISLVGFKSNEDDAWAKKMFSHSLIVITLLFVAGSVDSFIH